MAGESWLLRVTTLLQAVDLEERRRAEERWWRLRQVLGETEFDHLCSRLGPADLCEPTSKVDELLARVDEGWHPTFADAGLFDAN